MTKVILRKYSTTLVRTVRTRNVYYYMYVHTTITNTM